MTVEGYIAPDTSHLHERERELTGLSAALQDARQGAGSIVAIAGAAGTGKSALLGAAVRHASKLGFAVRRARGSELEEDLSFGVIRQLFEAPLSSASASERERLLSGAAAPAARLFASVALDPAAGADGGFATLHGLYWLAANVAAEQPLLLAVDDIHWADAPSLRALNYLAGRLADVPVALAVALRTHEPTGVAELVASLESQPSACRFELAAFDQAAVAAIVRAEIAGASDELCAAFHDASAGNPFYLRELLRSVSSRNGTMPAPGEIREAAVASVGDRVARRLLGLGTHAPMLAAAMSVLGSGRSIRDAAAVAGLEEADAAGAARAMRRAEILAAESPFEWIHPLVRRSLYDNLTVTERDRLHARAADVLARAGAAPGAVAVHLSALRPAGSEAVVARLLAAADEALARDAPEVAVALLDRALEEDAADPPRASLLLKLGQVEVTRRNPAAAEPLREARELSRDTRERTLAAMALAEILTFDGHWDQAAATISEAIDGLAGADPDLTLELEVVRAVWCAFDPPLSAEVSRDRGRLLALAGGPSWPARALAALLAVTSALRGEHLEEIEPLCEHALADGVLFSQRGAGAWASSHVLAALTSIEQNDRAFALADELEDAAREQGSVANALIADAYRGWIPARLGDLTAAEELLRPIVDTAISNNMLLYLVTGLWWLRDVLPERPAHEDLTALVESLELPPAFAQAAGGAWMRSVRGNLRATRGALGDAEQDFRAAGEIFRALGFGPVHDPWRSSLALTLGPRDAEEARALVEEELALADATGLARPCGVALRALGLITGGDDGLELLRESVAVLADSPARYEHARALVELGAALRRSGRRAESREPLEAGMEIAHLGGAERLVARARQELLATGARPRQIIRSGFTALTASERRIVRLAAEGHSNPEIAQTLYVSVKTVESHLSGAYRKLDLSGPGARRRLPELVGRVE